MTYKQPHSLATVTLALLTLVSLGVGLTPSVTLAQESSRTFSETGKTVRGKFLKYWTAHGGLAQQGFPISDEMQEESDTDGRVYTVQYFERAVFEQHSENQSPNDVLLSLLAVFLYKQKYPNGAPGQIANSSAGSVLFNERGHRVGGKFLDYWKAHGGLAQQGYPISDEFTEVSALNGKPYTVQYFERAVFEQHPENSGTQYEVLLAQLGRFRLDDAGRYNATPGSTATTPVATSTALPPTNRPTSVPTANVPAAATDWLQGHISRLRTVEPDGGDNSDLLPLSTTTAVSRK